MTDTEKWNKEWFRKLKPIHKCFWEFIRDNCNHAGIWEVDIQAAQFYINARLNKDNLLTIFQGHILKITETKWYLIDFIEFQYKVSLEELNPANKLHNSIICLLEKYKIKQALAKPLSSPLQGAKDKELDKDKNKDKEKEIFREFPILNNPEFLKSHLEWIEYRKGIKKPLTPITFKKQLEFLSKQPDPIAVINQSIKNGWQGLFEINGQRQSNKNIGKQTKGIRAVDTNYRKAEL